MEEILITAKEYEILKKKSNKLDSILEYVYTTKDEDLCNIDIMLYQMLNFTETYITS